ncbi:hypothetical protein [Streptomyces sp. NPDC050560]|uniref:hypothetical protein n=1 Tax=Streptomyces sp. NPDC050560 TaxID=3365630 RepID=UPI00379FE83E
MTVGEWLAEWLTSKADLRPTTHRSYESHIRLYLTPHLGQLRLGRLRVAHIQAMFTAITQHNEAITDNNTARHTLEQAARQASKDGGRETARILRARLSTLPPYVRTVGAAGRQSVRATLRAALSDAQAQQLVQINVAKLVKLAPAKRPKAQVWTPERILAWQQTGEKPSPVMVWNATHTATFLTRARRHHQLGALLHLVAFTGLRRGEACGLRWIDLSLEEATMQIRHQIV